MPASGGLSVISLYTGAGGLDLGLEVAGFRTRLCIEIDEEARETLQANRPRWKLADPGDIMRLDARVILRQAGLRSGEATLLAGGPPCQPFSKSRYWSSSHRRPLTDPRAAMLSRYLQVLEGTLPEAFLLENVAGLTYNGRDDGLRLLVGGIAAINKKMGTRYEPVIFELNCADYGVPQIRRRVFIIGQRDGAGFELPPPTHGPESGNEPYHTAWEAIGKLDNGHRPAELEPTGKWADLLPSIPEGHNYLWHTSRGGGEPLFGWRTRYWSFLLKLAKDQPSWTIQAGPGPATGPFHWKSRLLSIQELAALQAFPPEYTFSGGRKSCQRQIGNAVPPPIGELLGLELRRQLLGQRPRRSLKLLSTARSHGPRRERRRPVPSHYLDLKGTHPDHPGKGAGPGAARLKRGKRGVVS